MSQAPALPENLTDPVVGLTAADVAERVARGQANDAPDARSRSLGDIVRANTFTWFNGLIGSLWLVMLLVAPIQDSLFGFVIVANTGIGIIQEWRASRTLAKLAVIGEAKPVVRRDGADVEVSPGDVVLDDLIVLRTGDQLVVDGVVVEADGLEIDESLLTGEADPVDMVEGAPAMSGSFVVAGSGLYQATRVGKDSFAAGLTEQAKNVGGVTFLAHDLGEAGADDVRNLVLDLRGRLGNDRPSVVLGAGVAKGRPVVVIATNEAARGRGIKAGELVRTAATTLGGGGGGKDDIAQGGGQDPTKVREAMGAVEWRVGELAASAG